MKKSLYILVLFIYSFNCQAQILNYTDLGILLSSENTTGTARLSGLNGSIGAIGGDLSATQTNPASGAIFNQNEFTTTLGFKNNTNSTTYYSNKSQNSSFDSNLDQIGGVFILNSIKSNWQKIALTVNYQVNANFNTNDFFEGNSGYASFNTHPNDEGTEYNTALNQSFHNITNGKTSKLNIAIAGQYNQKIHFGGGMNFHSLNFSQTAELNEQNQDSEGNELNGQSIQNISQTANGISFSTGMILNPIHELRLGLALHSPTWYYNITEDYNSIENIAAIPNKEINSAPLLINNSFYEYKLRTPYKITASTAFVLGKVGFINIDYTYKGYNSLKLDNDENSSDFTTDNQYFNDVLQNTNNITIGGEIRISNLSFRGGVGYEQSPFKDNIDSNFIDVIKLGDKYSGSIGLGYRIGNSKLDVAYRKTQQENQYDFYDNKNTVNTALIENKNSNLIMSYTYLF